MFKFQDDVGCVVEDLVIHDNILFVTGPFINSNNEIDFEKYHNQDLLSKCDFRKRPRDWWEYHRKLLTSVRTPTFGHQALYQILDILINLGKTPHVITQNLDDLHEQAGIKNENILIHSHGISNKLCCPNSKCKVNIQNTVLEKKTTDTFHAICSSCSKILVPYSLYYDYDLDKHKDMKMGNVGDIRVRGTGTSGDGEESKIERLSTNLINHTHNKIDNDVDSTSDNKINVRTIINNYMNALNQNNGNKNNKIKILFRIEEIMKYAAAADVLIFIGVDPVKNKDSFDLMQFLIEMTREKCHIYNINLTSCIKSNVNDNDDLKSDNKEVSISNRIHINCYDIKEINVSPDTTLMSIFSELDSLQRKS